MEELELKAMGTDVHIICVGGPRGLLSYACDRVAALEAMWSRFVPHSELSRATANAGSFVTVSPETVELVSRAVEAWRFTGGAFDPTVLGAVVRAGYDRTFDELGRSGARAACDLVVGCTDIEIATDSIRLPYGTGFDPGGIGKGFAADIVTRELLDRGAAGACVNVGGDLRAAGDGPEGVGWTVAIDHPRLHEPLAMLGIDDGAIATSTTLRRRWTIDGEERHHLIDPRTGEPSTTDVQLATVVAGEAWTAEALAKAVLLRGSAHPFDIVEGSGAEALIVTSTGDVRTTDGFAEYVGYGWIPERVALDA